MVDCLSAIVVVGVVLSLMLRRHLLRAATTKLVEPDGYPEEHRRPGMFRCAGDLSVPRSRKSGDMTDRCEKNHVAGWAPEYAGYRPLASLSETDEKTLADQVVGLGFLN